MLGAQLGEETLPVFRVIVDSVEARHIYVGHQPLIGAKHHLRVCTYLDGNKNKMKKIHFCTVLICLQCSEPALEINLTLVLKEPVLLFSSTVLNPRNWDEPLVTRAFK